MPTTYRFRLAAGPRRDRIPQFFVNGRWRSVTGDTDFLRITHADGSPLTTAERAKVYADLSHSVVGMPHGEAASWTNTATQFDFPLKIAQFETGTAIQFGPDGIARAVDFVKQMSEFRDALNYHVQWTGEYEFP